MTSLGPLCLLLALVGSGYAAFVHLAGGPRCPRALRRAAGLGTALSFAALTAVVVVLGWALVVRDFRFDYVVRYSSRLLSWHYALSALWVGQAGSLLLWAWVMAAVACLLRGLPAADTELRDTATGALLANLCFLTAIMVFAADPLKPSLGTPREGMGLSPLLQHPSMLSHPPIVFVAYALWTVPCALALAALLRGRLDSTWAQMARPWALVAWAVLGVGLLLGANWAYQELGWGGYWGWDPVENGSFLPWLSGTALIHCLMAWRHRQCLKRSAVVLALLTCGLCNFATFLTRSGVFSSVHAFSESPIGWMFLGFMGALLVGGTVLVVLRHRSLVPERQPTSLLARESLIVGTTALLLLLCLVIMGCTLATPLSSFLRGRTVMVDVAVYNGVLTLVALPVLAVTAAVPLLRWGEGPGLVQRRLLGLGLALALTATVGSHGIGLRHPTSLAVVGLTALALWSVLSALVLDARRREPASLPRGLARALLDGRRQYAGYVVHLGLLILALGIAGSSLGSQRVEVEMNEGELMSWAGRDIRYVRLEQQTLPDKLIAEAVLEISEGRGGPAELRPARHFHRLQEEWTTEVAIHSTWGGDFYTILQAGLGDGKVALTFVDNPLMRWLWLGGGVSVLGGLVALWPTGRRAQTEIPTSLAPVHAPEATGKTPRAA